ncbi:MAG: hypothetical protein ACLPPF_21075 [Rhodomicrobium sp.]
MNSIDTGLRALTDAEIDAVAGGVFVFQSGPGMKYKSGPNVVVGVNVTSSQGAAIAYASSTPNSSSAYAAAFVSGNGSASAYAVATSS